MRIAASLMGVRGLGDSVACATVSPGSPLWISYGCGGSGSVPDSGGACPAGYSLDSSGAVCVPGSTPPNPSPAAPPVSPAVGACGANPCTWWDDIWTRDACLTYLRCANPSSPLVIAADHGFFAGAGAAVGQAAGSAASGVAGGVLDTTTMPGWMLAAAALVGGIFLLKALQ